MEFIILDDIKIIDFINNFWFIIDYKDLKDLTYLENTDFYINDLNKLRAMRISQGFRKWTPDLAFFYAFVKFNANDVEKLIISNRK